MALILILSVLAIVGAILGFQLLQKAAFSGQLSKARELMDSAEHEKAKTLLDVLLNRKKEDTQLRWLKAQCEISTGQYLLGIVLLNDILQSDSYTSEVTKLGVHMALAQAYESSGRLKEAMAEYYAVADLEPDSFEANMKIADYLFDKGSWNDSEKCYKKAHLSNPTSVEPCLKLAQIGVKTKDLDMIDNFTAKVLRIEPENEQALYLAGASEMEKRDFVLAVQYFEKCQAAGGSMKYRAGVQQAVCEWSQGRAEEAVPVFEKSLRPLSSSDPVWIEGQRHYIHALIETRRFQNVEQELRKYLAANREDMELKPYMDIFAWLYKYPKLMDFASLSRKEQTVRLKNLFVKFGFIIDFDREKNEVLAFMKVSRLIKSGQKLSEMIFLYTKPEFANARLIMECQEVLKKEMVRSGFIFSPFEFHRDAKNLASTVSLNLVSGDIFNNVLSGMDIFI